MAACRHGHPDCTAAAAAQPSASHQPHSIAEILVLRASGPLDPQGVSPQRKPITAPASDL